jgi:soluble lytic murein transglycosylase-like protein
MHERTDARLAGLTDVRNTGKMKKCLRISLAMVSIGFAGAMLLSSLCTGLASAAPVVNHVQTSSMSSPLLHSIMASTNTYQTIARQAARHYGLDPNLFVRQINQESGFNPRAVSPAGAEGIAQFMPATAASMGVDPWNPTSALYGAARLMSSLKHQFHGHYGQALGAYNAGSGAVQYAIRVGGSRWYFYLPAETRHYISAIMGR